ncbi:MAG: hypothetical protein ABI690_04625 [Chloroflexota bacterium]
MQKQKPVQRQQYGCLGMFVRMILDVVVFRFITKRILNWLNNRSRSARS